MNSNLCRSEHARTPQQVSGGAAERDGTVMVGDVIIAVDDREVIGEPLAVLRSLILGQQGSTVKLSL